MVHCVGVSIGEAAVVLVVIVVLMLVRLVLYCKHSNTLKKQDKAGQLPTTVSTQHMIIVIIMTHAVHILLFIAGQLC